MLFWYTQGNWRERDVHTAKFLDRCLPSIWNDFIVTYKYYKGIDTFFIMIWHIVFLRQVVDWLTNNIHGYPSGAKAIALCTLFTFCFVLVLVDLPSSVGNSSLVLRQSNDCSGTSGTTLKNSRECQLLKGTMDKKLYTLQTVIWNYLFMPKLQRCNHWILRMDKLLYPTFPWSVITYSFQDWN